MISTFSCHDYIIIFLSLNYTLFSIDDVDAGRQGVQVGGTVGHLDAVKVVNGLAGNLGR